MIRLTIPESIRKLHQSRYAPQLHKVLRDLSVVNSSADVERMFASEIDKKTLRVASRFAVTKIAKRYFGFLSRKISLDIDESLISGGCQYIRSVMHEEKDRFGAANEPQKEIKGIRPLLAAIFNYDGFRTGNQLEYSSKSGLKWHADSASGWGGYQFIKALKVTICPYCGADTVYAFEVGECYETPKRKQKKIRFVPHRSSLDHFFPRSEYPYLGITLCNLVPSCFRCNTQLKGSFLTEWEKHSHPYADDIHKLLEFYVEDIDIERIKDVRKKGGFKLSLRKRFDSGNQCDKNRAYTFMQDVMHTDEVYSALFKDEIRHILYKTAVAAENEPDFYSHLLGSDIERFLYGMRLSPDEILRHRLGKLIIDVNRQWPSISTSNIARG